MLIILDLRIRTERDRWVLETLGQTRSSLELARTLDGRLLCLKEDKADLPDDPVALLHHLARQELGPFLLLSPARALVNAARARAFLDCLPLNVPRISASPVRGPQHPAGMVFTPARVQERETHSFVSLERIESLAALAGEQARHFRRPQELGSRATSSLAHVDRGMLLGLSGQEREQDFRVAMIPAIPASPREHLLRELLETRP